MKKKLSPTSIPITYNDLARVVHRDAPAIQVLKAACEQKTLPIQIQLTDRVDLNDYTQIDPTLSIEAPVKSSGETEPRPGLGYAGLTPYQRHQFLTWLNEPSAAAPVAFQQLYLAHLEVRLLEGGAKAKAAQAELQRLQQAPNWQASEPLVRTLLLSYWLTQDGPGLAAWLAEGLLPAAVLSVAIGCQALLHEGLHAEEIIPLAKGWEIAIGDVKPAVFALRLNSLTLNLGNEPLAYALAQIGEDGVHPQPWRCVHRALRIALPQPALRPLIEPLLVEILASTEGKSIEQPMAQISEPANEPNMEDLGWHLILEFGHSRSEFFEFALELTQRLETYTQLADEDRRLVHRVLFKKRDVRLFWRIWDYVQSWSSTHVYLNGEELQKWKIYPYSPYLK